jgi:hypothetical protein
MRYLLALMLATCTVPVHAEIYKFVDDSGHVTYTNMPRPGAKKLELLQTPLPSTTVDTGRSKKAEKAGKQTSTPSYFPRVDTSTQRRRDDMRRQLLLEELRSEENNLSAARNAMAKGARQPGTDLNKLADAVRLHEKNIEMLNKELSHIR